MAQQGRIQRQKFRIFVNFRLIVSKLQDPRFQSGLKSMLRSFYKKWRHMGSDKSKVNIRGYLIGNLLLMPVFLGLILIPFRAEASVFSFISGLFSSAQVKAEETEPNSQNIPLLQAVISPNPNATSTEVDISIVGETSLSPVAVAAPGEAKTINNDQISLYVVHQGDTLPAIAKMFNVTVNTIRWGNDIKGNTISVGQTLVILPISGVQHVVKSGDTLQSIAKVHKGDLDEILQYNNLSLGSKLAVGDVIVIPDGETATVSVSSSKSVGTSKSSKVYEGYYMRPIVGGLRTQGLHGHNGVDLAGSYGSNILASADGEVIISRDSGWNGGYGDYIVIKHANGTQTLYGHLSATSVSVGDTVKQGQVIGKMGNSGQVKGPTGIHLHFEIRGARNPF